MHLDFVQRRLYNFSLIKKSGVNGSCSLKDGRLNRILPSPLEGEGGTKCRVRGANTPTFSTYARVLILHNLSADFILSCFSPLEDCSRIVLIAVVL